MSDVKSPPINVRLGIDAQVLMIDCGVCGDCLRVPVNIRPLTWSSEYEVGGQGGRLSHDGSNQSVAYQSRVFGMHSTLHTRLNSMCARSVFGLTMSWTATRDYAK